MPEAKPSPKPTREPQALSTEYHKARKQLTLWAGILLIWELVGVDLTKVETAGGSIGAIITAIKSPQAIPWTLCVLVLYFLFRFNVEWKQSAESRRLLRWAKIDFIGAWVISLAAFLLYLGQRASRLQFADALTNPTNRRSLIFGSLSALTIGFIIFGHALFPDLDKKRRTFVRLIPLVFAVFYAIILMVSRSLSWRFLFAGILLTSALLLAGVWANRSFGQ